MKNLTLMAFLLMTVFILTASGCAGQQGKSERQIAEENTQTSEEQKNSEDSKNHKERLERCKNLDPHGPDQYFEEYERCRGL